MLRETRRPRPKRAKNIGSWYRVLQAFGAISICTNAGVILFRGDFFDALSTTSRVWTFTLFVSAMFFVKYLLEVSIDDVPTSVRAQLQRQQFLVEKCLYHVPDATVNHNNKHSVTASLELIAIGAVAPVCTRRQVPSMACLDIAEHE